MSDLETITIGDLEFNARPYTNETAPVSAIMVVTIWNKAADSIRRVGTLTLDPAEWASMKTALLAGRYLVAKGEPIRRREP